MFQWGPFKQFLVVWFKTKCVVPHSCWHRVHPFSGFNECSLKNYLHQGVGRSSLVVLGAARERERINGKPKDTRLAPWPGQTSKNLPTPNHLTVWMLSQNFRIKKHFLWSKSLTLFLAVDVESFSFLPSSSTGNFFSKLKHSLDKYKNNASVWSFINLT